MAGKAAKKISGRNDAILKNHFNINILVMSLVIAIRVYQWNFKNMGWFSLLNGINMAVGYFFVQEHKSGIDLSEDAGVPGLLWDVIYIDWVVLIGSCFSYKFYFLLLLIPLFVVYKIKTLVSGIFGALKTK